MDAGARGRRLLQRREYRAKVSEFIPKELEDHVVYENPNTNLFSDKTSERIINTINKASDAFKNNKLLNKIGSVFKSKNTGSNYTKDGKVTAESNSAQQKAMNDAKMKKMEDDKVASKKKGMKEGTKYGMYKGSGKASGAMKDYLDKKKKEKKKVDEACWKGYEKKGMKTMFGKRYPNCVKKTKKEEVQLEAKYEKGKDRDGKESIRNKRAFGYDRDPGVTKPEVLSGIRKDRHAMRRGVKKKDRTKLNDVVVAKSKRKPFEPIPKGRFKEDVMLVKEDMKGMSQKSGDKRSTESGAGMTAKGVAKYNRRTGGNLKTAVTTPPSKLKAGSKAANRRKSFCARSKSWTGPRGKAARRRWNCSYEPELPMIIDERKKLYNSAPLSDRVAAWANKISESSPLTPGRNDFGLPTGLKSGTKKNTEKKINPKNLPVAMASYEPQGEVIQEMPNDLKNVGMNALQNAAGEFSKTGKVNVKGILRNAANKALKTDTVNKFLNTNSYEPQGELVEMGGKGKGAINSDVLKNNPNLDPTKPSDYIKLKRLSAKVNKINERKMTSSEKDKKEKYVKGMKKVKGDFTKRYGKDGKSVMYATATKMAMKEESCGKGQYYCYDDKKCKPIPEGMKVGKDGMLVKEDFYKKKFDVRKGGYQKTNKMTKSNKRSGDSKAQYRQVHKDLAKENIFKGVKGDGYLGKTPIPNPIRLATDVVDNVNKREKMKIDRMNQVDPNSGSIKIPKRFNPTISPATTRYLGIRNEGSLHKWFKGSKSKDGKGGWVNVVTGGTCASDKPGEGTPKCVSSSKRASMSKSERLSASRRKKKADPGQQSKSGAAKPTYVATDSKKKK